MLEHHRKTIRRMVGGLILLAGVAVFSWPAFSQSTQTSQGQQSVNGRFTIIFNPEIRADMFLLDTQTGKTWSRVRFTSAVGEPVVWSYDDRLDSLEDRIAWESVQTLQDSIR